MKSKTCCFTGHRNIPNNEFVQIQSALKNQIIKYIQKGVRYFGVGGALGFDTLAALEFIELKKLQKQIKLILVLPCPEQTKHWNQNSINIYKYIYSNADKVVYTSKHYFNGCMHKRNRHLVENSKFCICYLTKNTGGTAYTVNYAKTKGLEIINIYQG